ncbi:MAG TPA: hypothetical protein VFE38_05740 [Edaphobacter sp.]|nr:hypothetical protein [Edaphobacter sp.]
MEQRLNTIANYCIIVVAVLTVFFLVRNEMFNRNKPKDTAQKLIGKQFPLQQNWAPYRYTVVLALQVGCHFCEDSAPFYRKLSAFVTTRNENMVALFPQAEDESRKYLNTLSVIVPSVKKANFSDLKVTGTPTLFIIDRAGNVKSVWRGELSSHAQNQVLEALN